MRLQSSSYFSKKNELAIKSSDQSGVMACLQFLSSCHKNQEAKVTFQKISGVDTTFMISMQEALDMVDKEREIGFQHYNKAVK